MGYLEALLRKGSRRAGFTKPLPRKGTETSNLHCLNWLILIKFTKPLPRKGTETSSICNPASTTSEFTKPLPRKGTETEVILEKVPLPRVH